MRQKNKATLIYGMRKITNEENINIGDYIQSLAALEIVGEDWRNLSYVNREELYKKINEENNVKLIANGWYTHNQNSFPINDNINPLFISVHIDKKLQLTDEVIESFKKFQPIGCRDKHTVKLLESVGIKAYFSGCLTLSFKKRQPKKREGIVFIVDNLYPWPKWCFTYKDFLSWKGSKEVIDELKKTFSMKQIEGAKFLRQHSSLKFSVSKQFKIAEKRLKTLSEAELVVTTRIHSLMPSMALGTPSLLIIKNNKDWRFDGLSKYWNYIDFTDKNAKISIRRNNENEIINDSTFLKDIVDKNNKIVQEYWNN